MPSRDEIVLFLKDEINPEEMMEAKREGNLLEYLSIISKKMIDTFRMGSEPQPSVERTRREVEISPTRPSRRVQPHTQYESDTESVSISEL